MNPIRRAKLRAALDLPDPEGPSIATTMRRNCSTPARLTQRRGARAQRDSKARDRPFRRSSGACLLRTLAELDLALRLIQRRGAVVRDRRALALVEERVDRLGLHRRDHGAGGDVAGRRLAELPERAEVLEERPAPLR